MCRKEEGTKEPIEEEKNYGFQESGNNSMRQKFIRMSQGSEIYCRNTVIKELKIEVDAEEMSVGFQMKVDGCTIEMTR